MGKKEIKTNKMVRTMLEEVGIIYDEQGSDIKEIDEALKTASKNGKGNAGFPEFVAKVNDFIIVIEDKADLTKHCKLNESGIISLNTESGDVEDYAVNGALFYAKHIVKNTSYKKVFAFGVSGNEKRHKITPLYVDEGEYCVELKEVDSLAQFSKSNIDSYYKKNVLKEALDVEATTAEILKYAAQLHEDLRNYGNITTESKPLVVSGILLALDEIEYKAFSIDNLNGDQFCTDGEKICNAISSKLDRANVGPASKKDKLLSQFAIIRNSAALNEVNETLGETPLKHYTKFLYEKIFKSIKATNSAEDYIGRFYGEFMSYGGGDGQSLGIVLTPKHITELFCDLLDVQKEDVCIDPCCGTAGFLIAAMHREFNQIITEKGFSTEEEKKNDPDIRRIKQNNLHGIELQPYMFAIAVTNMILRGDGQSNIKNENFLKCDSNALQLKHATVGMINPPYSQGSKANSDLYEICFIEHLLNSLANGGRCAAIVPLSSMTGKTSTELSVKESILKNHTLEGVITCNKNTFYGVGVMPCIVIFTAHQPHPTEKEVKFINFEDDGYKVFPHLGLLDDGSSVDKKQHLLDVWNDRIEADSKFCVKAKNITAKDEWLHSFFYFNDEIPNDADFEKTVGDYLSFEFSMIMQGRKYLFEEDKKDAKS